MVRIMKIVLSPIGLAILLVLYSIVGSMAFLYLEQNYSWINKQTEESSDKLTQAIEKGYNELKEKFGTNPLAWKQIENVMDNIKESKESSSTKPLDFWGSLYYCFTVYTTIGYGNIFPSNGLSRIFTCVYALFGIPLCLACLDRISKLQVKIINGVYRKFWSFVTSEPCEQFSISCILGLILIYIASGCFVYLKTEKWDINDTLYFLFISFSTIGFGDLSPEDPEHFIYTIIYQFFGLSLVASLFNLLSNKFDDSHLHESEQKVVSDKKKK